MKRQRNSEVIPLAEGLQANLEGKRNFIEDFNQQTAELSVPPYTLETEQATIKNRLREKTELDARFAEIIEIIRETRNSIEQTIAREFEQKGHSGRNLSD